LFHHRLALAVACLGLSALTRYAQTSACTWCPLVCSWVVLTAAQHQRSAYGIPIRTNGIGGLLGDLVVMGQFTALFDKAEYRVFHLGIMDSQVYFDKICCWFV
jgi:hypothetical protein